MSRKEKLERLLAYGHLYDSVTLGLREIKEAIEYGICCGLWEGIPGEVLQRIKSDISEGAKRLRQAVNLQIQTIMAEETEDAKRTGAE